MTFDHLPPSRPVPRRAKTDAIFAVGTRAFVHWPLRGSQPLGPVPLLDAAGEPLANDLADGQQLEILSWRPRSREGLLYQVRRLEDGSEWWVAARYLRRHPAPEPAASVTAQ